MSDETKHVVMFSGGIGSWATARRVADRHGTDNLVLLFADVKGVNPDPHVGEDEDTYRFIEEAAAQVGGKLVTVRDGRDIWEVFKEDRFLGNSRLANCSKFLKQIPCRQWLDANCHPEDTVVYVGIDWTEMHRLPAIKKAYLPYRAEAPLTQPPWWDKVRMIEMAKARGLKPPRLYADGFPHNNCGGGCVRAGQAQFRLLLEKNRDRYLTWEHKEEEVRQHLGKPVSILRDRRGGTLTPLTLRSFRERFEGPGEAEYDELDFGGCGCFVEEPA